MGLKIPIFFTTLLILLLSERRLVAARICHRGSFYNGLRCQLCPRGTFTDSPGQTECRKCPAGTFNPILGAQGEDICKLCMPGTFGTRIGASSRNACRPCPPGQSSCAGAVTCRTCPTGFAVRDYNCNACTPCRFGTYSSNGTCVSCPTGTTTIVQRAQSVNECRPCPYGTNLRDGRCSRCPQGNRQRDCLRCPPGMFGTPETNFGLYGCQLCRNGTYSSVDGSGVCHACPPGSSTVGPGSTFCKRDDLPCPTNFFTSRSGRCLSCLAGYRLDARLEKCVICPRDSISSGGTETVCRRCPREKLPNFTGNTCLCAKGTEWNNGRCRACLPGTMKEDPWYQRTEVPCSPCPINFFSRRGASECDACPKGTVSQTEGSRRCYRCPRGLQPGPEGLEDLCVDPATNCPSGVPRSPGTSFNCSMTCANGGVADQIGGTRAGRCFTCRPGSIRVSQPRGPFLQGCHSCDRLRDFANQDTNTCDRCPLGFIGANSECVCTGWIAGGHELRADGRCVVCQPGTFNEGWDGNDQSCKPCPIHTHASHSIAKRCYFCPPDYHAPTEGSNECIPCPNGTGSYGVGDGCVPLL